MSKTIEKHYLQKGLAYESYRLLIDELLSQGKTTGEDQSEQRIEYTRQNVATMQKIDKIIQLVSEVEHVITALEKPQTWLVLAEGWCRDAAQVVPVLNALAGPNENIKLRLLLRDENLELMDQYLTNGNSRSIPRLIAVDSNTRKELFNWGASPAIQQSTSNEKWSLIQIEIGELVARYIQEKAFV